MLVSCPTSQITSYFGILVFVHFVSTRQSKTRLIDLLGWSGGTEALTEEDMENGENESDNLKD